MKRLELWVSPVGQLCSSGAVAFCQGPPVPLYPLLHNQAFFTDAITFRFHSLCFFGELVLVVWFFHKYVGQKELWIFLLPTTDGPKKIFTGASNFK